MPARAGTGRPTRRVSSTTLGLLAVVAATLSLAAPATAQAAVRAASAAGGAVAGPTASVPARSVGTREVRASLGHSATRLGERQAAHLLPLLAAVAGALSLTILAAWSARHAATVGAAATRLPVAQGRAPPARVLP